MTKLCLVWAVWTHSKRFLDWIAWAIPWYDELNLAFLIWLILMGPSAADTVFRYTIERMAKPYEKSFDSVLGTTHDALQIIMYLITCGPKALNLKWQSWKARQFNKSLLSSTNNPPSRLPVLNRHQYHFQSSKLKPTTLPSDRGAQDAVASTSAASTYLLVPEKKRTLSRTLSAGYKRAVSNSRPKPFLGEPGLYSTRSVSTNRAVYPFGVRASGSSFGTSISNQPLQLSSKPNRQTSNYRSPHHQDSKHLPDHEEEINSIIIHDDSIISPNEPVQAPSNSIYGPPVQLSRQKRARNMNDELDALALRKAKKALRRASTKPTEKPRSLNPKNSSLQVVPSPTQPEHPTVSSSSIVSSESIPLTSQPATEDSGDHTHGNNMTWEPLPSNAVLPVPDPAMSPSQVPAPTGKRRLHDPNEPLPLSKSLKTQQYPDSMPTHHHEVREQALDSVRSLVSTDSLPSLNQSTGRLASLMSTTHPKPSASTSTTIHTNKKISSSSPSKSKPLIRKRPISGKVGQQKVAMAAKKFDLLHSSPGSPSSRWKSSQFACIASNMDTERSVDDAPNPSSRAPLIPELDSDPFIHASGQDVDLLPSQQASQILHPSSSSASKSYMD